LHSLLSVRRKEEAEVEEEAGAEVIVPEVFMAVTLKYHKKQENK